MKLCTQKYLWMHLYSSVHSFLHPFNHPSHSFLFGHETNYRVFWIILEVSVFGSFSQFAEPFFAAKSELRKELYISKTITVLGSWGHFLRGWQSVLRRMLDFFFWLKDFLKSSSKKILCQDMFKFKDMEWWQSLLIIEVFFVIHSGNHPTEKWLSVDRPRSIVTKALIFTNI